MLEGAGFRVSKPRIFEANTLFDTPQGSLWRSGRLLRLRRAGPQGILTYKGASVPGKHKDREELETPVSDVNTMSEILARLDFTPGFRYEKYRTEYQRAGEAGLATLDETPIGVYLELEGTPAWIDAQARRLGIAESAYITSSYYGLYVDYCRRRGLEPTHMTFGGG